MKTTIKAVSVISAALAVAFSMAGVSLAADAMPAALQPESSAICVKSDMGATSICEIESNLQEGIIFAANPVITSLRAINAPVNEFVTTSLRGINDLVPAAPVSMTPFYFGAR